VGISTKEESGLVVHCFPFFSPLFRFSESTGAPSRVGNWLLWQEASGQIELSAA